MTSFFLGSTGRQVDRSTGRQVDRSRLWVLSAGLLVLGALWASAAEPAYADAWHTSNSDYYMPTGASRTVGNCELRMQSDGNLVVYRWLSGGGYVVEFATYTFGVGYRAKLQVDGNLVVYNSNWYPVYQRGTGGNPGSTWVLTKNCSLKVYDPNSSVLSTVANGTSGTGVFAPHPSGHGYANNSNHRWATTESNSADRNEWLWRFRGPGGEYAVEPTDLTFSEWAVPETWLDVWWFVQTQTPAGKVWCSHSHSGICNRFYLTISETAENLPSNIQNNLVCHELGHTIGFNDGGTLQTSCMTGGHTAKYNTAEINMINSRW